LAPVLFKFYIQGVLKLKKNNSGAKGLNDTVEFDCIPFRIFAHTTGMTHFQVVRAF